MTSYEDFHAAVLRVAEAAAVEEVHAVEGVPPAERERHLLEPVRGRPDVDHRLRTSVNGDLLACFTCFVYFHGISWNDIF